MQAGRANMRVPPVVYFTGRRVFRPAIPIRPTNIFPHRSRNCLRELPFGIASDPIRDAVRRGIRSSKKIFMTSLFLGAFSETIFITKKIASKTATPIRMNPIVFNPSVPSTANKNAPARETHDPSAMRTVFRILEKKALTKSETLLPMIRSAVSSASR